MSTPLNLTSLLFSTALLLVGHGMQLTMLPLWAQGANIPDFIIAATASGYFLGFIAGCIFSPYVIFRVGHIRCFGSLAALFLSALLILGITENWGLWFLMRFILGAAISGLYSVIESWLNSQTNELNRGRILSIYAFSSSQFPFFSRLFVAIVRRDFRFFFFVLSARCPCFCLLFVFF